MVNTGIQQLGFTLAFLGFIGLIISVTMTEWKMSSHAGDNIIMQQVLYEGLWGMCVYQSTGQTQCKVYDSLLNLPVEVQITQDVLLTSILLCIMAILVASVGIVSAAGVMLIVAGGWAFAVSIWYGINPRQQFYDTFSPTNMRYKFGKAPYICCGAAALVIIGGFFVCCNCGRKSSKNAAHRDPSGQLGQDWQRVTYTLCQSSPG